MRAIPPRPIRWRQILETVLPLVLGVLALRMKDVLHQLGGSSAATLLLALVVIAFLIPQLRRYALVLICFGMCVFALNRMWEGIHTVQWHEAVWTDYAFVAMWSGIALFSGLAGVGEVWFESPRWAQQSYLAAVALYFIGHGGSEWLQKKPLFAIFLLLVGLIAFGGACWIGTGRKKASQPSPRRSRRGVRWIHEASTSEEKHNHPV